LIKKLLPLPCPFCGKKVKLIKAGANWDKGIECVRCGFNIYFFYTSGKNKGFNRGLMEDGLNAIIKAWNKCILKIKV